MANDDLIVVISDKRNRILVIAQRLSMQRYIAIRGSISHSTSIYTIYLYGFISPLGSNIAFILRIISIDSADLE